MPNGHASAMVPLPPAPRIPFRLVNLSVARGRSRSRREDPARRRPRSWLTPLEADLSGVDEAALLETGLAQGRTSLEARMLKANGDRLSYLAPHVAQFEVDLV